MNLSNLFIVLTWVLDSSHVSFPLVLYFKFVKIKGIKKNVGDMDMSFVGNMGGNGTFHSIRYNNGHSHFQLLLYYGDR